MRPLSRLLHGPPTIITWSLVRSLLDALRFSTTLPSAASSLNILVTAYSSPRILWSCSHSPLPWLLPRIRTFLHFSLLSLGFGSSLSSWPEQLLKVLTQPEPEICCSGLHCISNPQWSEDFWFCVRIWLDGSSLELWIMNLDCSISCRASTLILSVLFTLVSHCFLAAITDCPLLHCSELAWHTAVDLAAVSQTAYHSMPPYIGSVTVWELRRVIVAFGFFLHQSEGSRTLFEKVWDVCVLWLM
jgi:hypothetical protein